jgi:hypothetical protein
MRFTSAMITLTFRPFSDGCPAHVRAAYFRICADATLRGPDNDIAADYSNQKWRLGHRDYLEFRCDTPLCLRVTHPTGERERLGPFEFLRASGGAIFTNERCLGLHASSWKTEISAVCWSEIALLVPDRSA